jgi:hypothetical protein
VLSSEMAWPIQRMTLTMPTMGIRVTAIAPMRFARARRSLGARGNGAGFRGPEAPRPADVLRCTGAVRRLDTVRAADPAADDLDGVDRGEVDREAAGLGAVGLEAVGLEAAELGAVDAFPTDAGFDCVGLEGTDFDGVGDLREGEDDEPFNEGASLPGTALRRGDGVATVSPRP